MPALHWRDRALIPLRHASQIVGVSPASLYKYEAAGRLQFRRLAGRTLVTTKSLITLIDSAEEWKASDRGSQGRAARSGRARAAWES
jgi:hypothetical protein